MLSKTKTSREPKLPVTQLLILSICRFAEPVALTGVFPYLPEMIESFGVPPNEVAKWAGITSAVFSISQCLTAIQWGRASDKYGRKPIILMAMSFAMTSSLLFGFSRSLKWAIFARALSGASNGNVGILRTTVAEMVPQKSLQPRAFSILPLVWQIGSIVGPILGGALASPAKKMPQWFGNSTFFKTFPFALPNLVNSIFFTVGIIEGVLFLKESNEAKKFNRDYGRVMGSYLKGLFTGRGRHSRRISEDDFEYDGSGSQSKRNTVPTAPPRYREVFTPQSNLNLLCYCILALHGVAYDQLLPVFMHSPIDRSGVSLPFRFRGGFGIDSGRIGVIFMAYGVFSMITQFTLFPYFTNKFGALTMMRICTLVFPIAYFITPFTVLLPTETLQQAAILAVMIVKGLAGVFAFPCITILMTNSAKSLRLLGTLNGVATSLSAIGRAAGPYTCGTLFTWGVSHDYPVVAWWFLAFFAALGHISTWWLVEMDGFGGKEPETESSDDGSDDIMLDERGMSTTHTGADADMHDDAAAALLDSEDKDSGIGNEDEPLLGKEGKI
ncbi:permease of the major facilitator superfamily [Tothia fuscella]|uniref:Permease of the major facilitator superfamily n=1 Tax=Tothia fuscella TaxID=1048955 RepID=A0A9P4TSD6_9PEZI|nr:permease of the major facilitator superfamily [Tothia fuscella]